MIIENFRIEEPTVEDFARCSYIQDAYMMSLCVYDEDNCPITLEQVLSLPVSTYQKIQEAIESMTDDTEKEIDPIEKKRQAQRKVASDPEMLELAKMGFKLNA
tara:strand:+ start:1743 stop:2051 length:309 start_codon:yes stop_codon:yes gene_type:complete